MNPRPTPTPTLYGYPLAVWVLPRTAMGPLTARIYTEALAVLTEPSGPTARLWAREIEQDGYRAITHVLSLPQVHSLVAELPPRAIVALTGRRPDDAARQEAVRALYAPPGTA